LHDESRIILTKTLKKYVTFWKEDRGALQRVLPWQHACRHEAVAKKIIA